MAENHGTYVRVGMDPIEAGYTWVKFRCRFWPSSSSVYNGDGQAITAWNGSTQLWGDTIRGYLYAVTFDVVIDYGYPNPGTRHRMVPNTLTYDPAGDARYRAQVWVEGFSWYMPNWNVANFSLGAGTGTTRVVNYSNIDTPNNERISWANVGGAFNQTPNGSKSGSFTHTGLALNTSYSTAVGMVPANSAGPYLGNANGKITVYPTYTALSKGSISAARNTTTPSTVRVNWGAWSGFGNMTGWTEVIQVLDAVAGTVLKSQSINSTSASSVDVTGLPLDKSLNVRIMLTGEYHDGTTKTEYSTTVELGYLNNTFYKVGGTWRRGIRTYYKVGGVWRANNGLVRHKVGGAWK